MSEYTGTQIPKPSDEQTFERCNEVLWQCILRDETVQLHARRGQRQYGVDLTGIRDDQAENLVGVQCRLKSAGQSLTEAEIQGEVEKALTFSPPLSEYIIVTTAPDDGELQRLAYQLSISASKGREKPLRVRIWGWGTLEREIRRFPNALRAFDPSHTGQGDRIERKLGDLSEMVQERMAEVHRAVTQGHAGNPIVTETAVRSVLERQVNSYAELVSSDPSTALRLLTQLQGQLDDDVKGNIRFRVAANIAACQFNLGDEEAAAQGFIAAYELDPGNRKAIAHKALGLLLLRDHTTLKSFAKAQLSRQPDNAPLAAYYIRGMIADPMVTDPLDQVPEAVRGTPEVAEAHVLWLMDRGSQGAWWDAAIAAHEAHPDSDALSETSASALLERIVSRVGSLDRQSLTEDERTDVKAAIDIYEALWPQLRDDPRRTGEETVSIPINLIVAYRLGHQSEQAVETAHEALARFSGNTEVAKAAASVLMEQGEGAQAADLLSRLEIDRETVMMRFGIAMAIEDWDTVSDLVDNHLAFFPETEHDMARAARVLVTLNGLPVSERREVLEAELRNFQSDVRALIALARNAREHGLEDLGNRYFIAAGMAFDGGDDGLRARVSIASEALARGQPNVAADLLTDRLPLDEDTFELRLLARALVFDYPIRERALRFFEDLAPEVRSLPDFETLQGILHVNRGAPDDAVGPFSAAFELKPSIDNLMTLIGVYHRLGNTDAIAALVQREGIDALPGSALARVNLAHVLLSFGGKKDPLELGYEAVVEGLARADVVRRFLGLILREGMEPVPSHAGDLDSVVAPGTWIRLTSDRGESYESLVGEGADRPWGANADPTNPFVAKSLGLKIGESFEHEAAPGLHDTWTVKEVKPRWLQALHYLGKDFGRRFPDADGFFSIPIADEDIEPVLEQVRRHSEAETRRADLYLVKGFPIALVAGKSPGGAIAFTDYLTSIGKDLRVCYGTKDELSEALTLIEHNRRSGAVLDAATAWFAAGLGIFPSLEERLGPLAIPRSEFGRVQEMVARLDGVSDRESMTLTYHDGQYIRCVLTPEIQALRLEESQSRLAAIEEACTVESVVIPDELSDLGDRLLKFPFRDAFVPAVTARRDRLLLDEDMMMRQLAERAFGTKGVWLQAVLLSARQAGTMDWGDYCEALVQLAASRHRHVFTSAQVLLSVFERDMSTELVKLEAVCNYVGTPNAENVSLIESVARFINAIWADTSPADVRVETATKVVLRALLIRDGAEVDAERIQALAKKLGEGPRRYLASWASDATDATGSENNAGGES